jgi:hypothetical protein
LCGGSELWLGSAMPSWRMAGWLWKMAEASRESLGWRKEEGVVERRSLADWFFSVVSEVEWGSCCRDKREGLERAKTGLGEWSDHLL